jgi:hypothetical protein
MNHPSPLKSGLAMFIGAVILLAYLLINREATIVLVMSVVAALWGILWVFLQHQANISSQKEINAPAYQKPAKGKLVALTRVHQGFKQGWLATDHTQLLFHKGVMAHSRQLS